MEADRPLHQNEDPAITARPQLQPGCSQCVNMCVCVYTWAGPLVLAITLSIVLVVKTA